MDGWMDEWIEGRKGVQGKRTGGRKEEEKEKGSQEETKTWGRGSSRFEK